MKQSRFHVGRWSFLAALAGARMLATAPTEVAGLPSIFPNIM
ncbi:hypothetical protein [Bradyrhizobium sp.]|jgi:hypothetical protein